MTTSKILKDGLIRRAGDLVEWFIGTLEVRETRTMADINSAKLFCINFYWGDSSSIHDDDLVFLWEMFEDESMAWFGDPGYPKIANIPGWDVPEFALVTGLILAEKATEYFKSQSHKKHLLAAPLLADAIDARNFWIYHRGIVRCRNPDKRFVQAEENIQRAEKKLWFREIQRRSGRAGAEVIHSAPGGSRDKIQKIREIWATGKYTTRDICAEQECAAIGMSFSTARRALRNITKQT